MGSSPSQSLRAVAVVVVIGLFRRQTSTLVWLRLALGRVATFDGGAIVRRGHVLAGVRLVDQRERGLHDLAAEVDESRSSVGDALGQVGVHQAHNSAELLQNLHQDLFSLRSILRQLDAGDSSLERLEPMFNSSLDRVQTFLGAAASVAVVAAVVDDVIVAGFKPVFIVDVFATAAAVAAAVAAAAVVAVAVNRGLRSIFAGQLTFARVAFVR